MTAILVLLSGILLILGHKEHQKLDRMEQDVAAIKTEIMMMDAAEKAKEKHE